MLRRINKLEAQKRKAEDKRIIDRLQEQIDYWKLKVKENGGKVYGPSDFKKGDRIKTRFGMATIRKVNPKTISVWFDKEYLNIGNLKIAYDDLQQDCEEVGT